MAPFPSCKVNCRKCRPFVVLILLLSLQFALFAITVLISYAVESGVAHLHHSLFDLTPPLPLETSLMLYCVSLIAECITEVQHKNWTILSVKNHHIMLTVIPNIVYILVFSLAFINIFIEFQAFHTIDSWRFGVPEESWQTALYMLSISYLVFCLTRLIRKDLFQLFIKLPHHQHSHSVVLLIGFVSQCLSTCVYSIPICIIAFAAAQFQWHIGNAFTVMNSLGVGLGILGSYIETKFPWPKKRGARPYFWYENVIYSRVVFLEVILLPSVHYLFFEPRKFNFLNTKDRHVIYFTFCVSISLTHVVKILTTILSRQKSADLIFGWAWGKPDARTKNHMSQSGIDGGFLREGDLDENDDNDDNCNNSSGNDNNNQNGKSIVYLIETIETVSSPAAGNDTFIADVSGTDEDVNSLEFIEDGLPAFSFPRDLVRTPLAAIVYYGFRFIHKIEKSNYFQENYTEEPVAPIPENIVTSDVILNSNLSLPGDSNEPGPSSLQVSSQQTLHSEDINLNESLVPGICTKGVLDNDNNFRNLLFINPTQTNCK